MYCYKRIIWMCMLTGVIVLTSCSSNTDQTQRDETETSVAQVNEETHEKITVHDKEELTPAVFEIKSLVIVPNKTNTGEQCVVTVDVANTGGKTGIYDVAINIDGTLKDMKQVSVTNGETATVEFILTDLAVGKHSITVEEWSASLIIIEPEVITPEPEQIVQPPPDTMVFVDSTGTFDYKSILFDETSSLSISIGDIDPTVGSVVISGYDSRRPKKPFTFKWGDGGVSSGFFPATHYYIDKNRNYIATVTANYRGVKTDSKEVLILFVPSEINPISIPDGCKVSIPENMVKLSYRIQYRPSASLTTFNDSFFTVLSRETIEYVLTLVSMIQKEMANDDIFLSEGKFEQVILRDPDFGGMYSLWYTKPVSFGSADYGFTGNIEWSSFMHEMGHNITLNSPAEYYYGGKIDGNANAIFSETMAQIFAHATGYYLLNRYENYGISEELAADIKHNVMSSMQIVRNNYEEYCSKGFPFSTWNDYSSPEDETYLTFMTIAYKFFEHAEKESSGYMLPVKRMMALLQTFDSEKRSGYDPRNDTVEGETYRSTLMVAAVSYAFRKDLREEFRVLHFPIDDMVFEELYNSPDIKTVD